MDFKHGVAFLIAKISRTKPSQHTARITIEFNTYAMLNISNASQLIAKVQPFPLAYLETSELFRRLDLDPNGLVWQQLVSISPLRVDQTVASYAVSADNADGRSADRTKAIAEAKQKLAESLGIAAEKIQITIRL